MGTRVEDLPVSEAQRQLQESLRPRSEWPTAIDEQAVAAHERAAAELRALEERDRAESTALR